MLTLENICYQTEDGFEILKDISLKIENRFVAITGPNGSGKSTLAKIIVGILKPTSGKIFLDGVDITDMSITERAKAGISFAFQQPVRFKGLKVRDLMALALGRKASQLELCDFLSEVGLCAKEYIDRDLDASLSGGELKRIEIAMVLARGTKFNIFDEPEAGIDLWSFQRLIHVFEKMLNEHQGQILIISHQERILKIAEKIIYLRNGCVEKFDTNEKMLDEILTNANVVACPKIIDEVNA